MKNIELYEKNILSYKDMSNTVAYTKDANSLEYRATYSGCELKISLNPNTHIIDNAMVNECEHDLYKLGMMKAFCALIIGLPILEAQDHGVLRLENLLRDTVPHPIKGIIMPRNSCELFETPLHLIRDLYNQYSKEQNYYPLVNTYTPKEAQEWKSLPLNDREKIVFEKIKNFCMQHNIEEYEVKLIGELRVEFAADKEVYSSLAKLLFDMEKSIDKELGFSLEVMFTEKKDTNKKRQTRK
ncbi:MAG: hypothetical protein PHQ22_07410 [Sulfuricurvum sp.]|nr:hypothetical protein [Sulfuricurvum sp.]MDD5387001.1 hypothetical protein [Sulfuricurvum sp.]